MAVEIIRIGGKTVDDVACSPSKVVALPSGRNIKLTNIRENWAVSVQPQMPNAETLDALEKARRGEGVTKYAGLDELITSCEAFIEASDD